jgi:hypothetical protein
VPDVSKGSGGGEKHTAGELCYGGNPNPEAARPDARERQTVRL